MTIVLMLCRAGGPCRDASWGALARNLEAARAVPGARVVAVTDDPALAQATELGGLELFVLAAPCGPDPEGIIPAGGLQALAALAPGEATLVLDALAPGLARDALAQAARELAEGAELVIGVTPARDNPVQCDIHHALAALNIVCPMDEGAPGPDGVALTSAFPFDWAAFGFAHCAPGTLFRFPGPDSAQDSLPAPCALPDPGQGLHLLLEGPDSARRAIGRAQAEELVRALSRGPSDKLLAVAALPCETLLDFAVLGHGGGARLYAAAGLARPGARLHLRPLADPSRDAAASALEDTQALEGAPDAGLGMSGPLDAGEATGEALVATVLVPAEDAGWSDMHAPLMLESGLWSHDGRLGRRVMAHTGRHFTGRQDFPEYFLPCAALAGGTPEALARAGAIVLAGGARGVVLAGEDRP